MYAGGNVSPTGFFRSEDDCGKKKVFWPGTFPGMSWKNCNLKREKNGIAGFFRFCKRLIAKIAVSTQVPFVRYLT